MSASDWHTLNWIWAPLGNTITRCGCCFDLIPKGAYKSRASCQSPPLCNSCVEDWRTKTPLKWGSWINCKQYKRAKKLLPEPAGVLCDSLNHSCVTTSVGLYLKGCSHPVSSFQHRLMLTLLPSTKKCGFDSLLAFWLAQDYPQKRASLFRWVFFNVEAQEFQPPP